MSIPVYENYTDPQGQFTNYDTLDNTLNSVLQGQKHINIRSLNNIDIGYPETMFTIEAYSGPDLDTFSMGRLEGTVATSIKGDAWTAGTVGPTASLGNRNGLVLACTTGANVTQSVSTPVDLQTNFTDSDEISLALPSFPLSSLDMTRSSMTLSDGTNTVTLEFSNSLTTPINGNSEIRWARSSVDTILNPTTVTLTFWATANCTVTVAGIRLLAQTWSPLMLDMETHYHRFIPTVNRDGSIPTTPYPLVWRSDTPSSQADPRPINGKMGVLFNTGSIAYTNSISLYMRGRREALQTQLDLDGIDINSDGLIDLGYDQRKLNALSHQPDFGDAVYRPDPMSDLDKDTQAQLEAYKQVFLERLPDSLNLSYIQATLQWNSSSTILTLTNAEQYAQNTYTLSTTALSANSRYLMLLDLEDHSVRVTIDPVDSSGVIHSESRVFDSTTIEDDFTFERTKGRVGWSANLQDGDAYIANFRNQGLMYGEYRSLPFKSHTPVDGARLSVADSPDIELYTGASPYNGGLLTIDNNLSQSSDGSIRVTSGLGGIQIDPVVIEDFTNVQISFDLYWPKIAVQNGILPSAVLVNAELLTVGLPLGEILTDQWQHFEFTPLSALGQLTGRYSLVIYNNMATPITFNVDNVSIKQRTIRWAARSRNQDPWNQNPIDWVDFGDLLNDEHNGIVITQRGKHVQVRGQAFSQSAYIDKVYLRPKYAQLGRLMYP